MNQNQSYPNRAEYTKAPDELSKTPMAQGLLKDFELVNDECERLCRDIQSKLHNVLDLRQPEKENDPEQNEPLRDFMQGFRKQISVVSGHNMKLTRILDHLNQII